MSRVSLTVGRIMRKDEV